MKTSLTSTALRKSIFLFIIAFTAFEYLFYYKILVQFFLSLKIQFADSKISFYNLVIGASISLFCLMTYFIYWLTTSILLALPSILLSYSRYVKWISIVILIIIFWLWTIFINLDRQVFSSYQFHLHPQFLKLFYTKDFFHILHLSSSEKWTFSFYLFSSFLSICILFYLCCKNYYRFFLKHHLNTYLNIWLLIFAWFLINIFVHASGGHINHLSQIDNFPGIKSTVNFFLKDVDSNPIESISEHHAIFRMQNSNPIQMPEVSNLKTITQPYNIVWIMIDTLRYDVVNSQNMPHLVHFAQKNFIFNNHFSSGNATLAGVFGMFYSLPSNYFSSAIQHQQQPFLFDILEQAHYDFQIFVSGTLSMPPFKKNLFVKRTPQELHERKLNDVSIEDRLSTKAMIDFLSQNHPNPFFAYINFNTVHGYCDTNKVPVIYGENSKNTCNRILLNNNSNPIPLFNRYKNAVHFVDSQINQIFQTLEKQHLLDNTIVIITSDHGETFNEHRNNRWGHANTYANEVIHVPFILHWPKKAVRTINYPTSHYDIAPTLINYLIPNQKLNHPYSMGSSLFNEHPHLFLICGSYVTMAIIDDTKIIELHPDGAIKATYRDLTPISNIEFYKNEVVRGVSMMSHFFLKDKKNHG